MKKILFTILIASSLAAVSCSGFLDKDPNTGIPPEEAMNTVDDADQVLNGIYSAWISGSLYSSYLTLLPDIQADLVYAVNGFSNSYGDFWRWRFQPSTSEIETVYYALYHVIMRCNFFLSNYDKVKANTTAKNELLALEKFTGEVYNSRALAYSELIKFFCEAYDPAKASSQHGVSITDSFEIKEKYVQRSNLKDSYEFVLKDLELASEHMERASENYASPVPNGIYFNTATVDALKARVCLNMRDWEGAIEAASAVIDNKAYSYSLSNAFTVGSSGYPDYYYMWWYDRGSEVIMRIHMTPTNYGGSMSWPFHHYDMVNITPDFVPARWVLDAYGNSDFRYDTFFQSVTTDHAHQLTWPLLVKHYTNPEIDNGRTPPRFVNMPKIFRLSELYLIRAEAYYMDGQPGEANADLTTLRKQRIYGYGTANHNGTALLEQIKLERMKELIMEGHRLNDLKRWGDGFTRKPQSESLSTGDNLHIEASNPRFVWPIPQHEVDSNPGIFLNESNY